MPPPQTWTLDPRLTGDGLRPDQLRGRSDRPVSVTSPALEWSAIYLSQLTSPVGRSLYTWEADIIDDVYQGSVDHARVRIVETSVLNAPTTLGNHIRVSNGWSFDGRHKPVLVHEFGHIWQYQNRGTNYITCSVYHNASGQIGTGNRNVAYMNYQLSKESAFDDFSAEEQATIIGDYYELTRLYADPANLPAYDNGVMPAWVGVRGRDLAHYERLMRTVRAARPRDDRQIYQEGLMGQQPGFDPFRDITPPDRQLAPTMPLLQFRFRGL